MYETTTTRVVEGEGASEEFEVKIGLKQGSVQIPAAVHSRGTHQQEDGDEGCHAEILHANGKPELQETLEPLPDMG